VPKVPFLLDAFTHARVICYCSCVSRDSLNTNLQTPITALGAIVNNMNSLISMHLIWH